MIRAVVFGVAGTFLAIGVMVSYAWAQHDSETPAETAKPAKAENFRLMDHLGQSHELHRYGADSKAIVLYTTGNGCPIAQKSVPALKALRDKYAPEGVVFLMLNGNPLDTREDVASEAKEFGIDIPILLDEAQLVVKSLGVERTCEAILINPKDWAILYRGAIDDSIDYTARKPEPTETWLDDAIQALLKGEEIKVKSTPVKGCKIFFAAAVKDVSYTQDIVPIVQGKCVACHSPGNVGPFSFSSHQRVKTWGPTIKEAVMSKRMPPWHADPKHGEFGNDRALTPAELRKFVAWIDAGSPADGEIDPLESVADMPVTEWKLGEPDMVISLPEDQQVSSTGVFDYRYIEVPSGLEEDKWVRAVEVRPSNREVAHHILVFELFPPEKQDQQTDPDSGLNGFFAGYVPGMEPHAFPENSGKYLPAGTKFYFQLHYTATGKEEIDRPQMALYFHEGVPDRVLATRAASNTRFEIPAGSHDAPTEAGHLIERDSVLWAMSPHMHYRGKRFQYEAQYPDGTSEVLLSVPNYDFNWQTLYQLKEPKHLPGGTRIIATGAFDNSPRNPQNPDPSATVYFGEQTYEEMFIGYMMYTFDPDSPIVAQNPPRERRQQPDEPIIHTGIMLDAQTIVGTTWRRGDRMRLDFKEDGVVIFNRGPKGKYEVIDGKVKMDIGGQQFELAIDGDLLMFQGRRGSRPLTPVLDESSAPAPELPAAEPVPAPS
ncbi:MAG: hypothetical protein AMXMBFR84_06550 [Candidatus Hydrogenedentota bacterium]